MEFQIHKKNTKKGPRKAGPFKNHSHKLYYFPLIEISSTSNTNVELGKIVGPA